MPSSINKDLQLAEKLDEEGKYEEVLKIIFDLEKKGSLSPIEQLSSDLIQGSAMVMLGQYNEVVSLAERIAQESQRLAKKIQIVDAFILKCRALYWLRRLDDILEILEQCERLLKILNDESSLEIKKREAWIALLRGLSYRDKIKRELQVKYLEQGLELGKETDNKGIIFKCLMLLGDYYTSKGEIDRALFYIDQCLEIAKLMQNQTIIVWSFLNLSVIYGEKGELDNCIRYTKKACKIFKRLNNKSHFSATLNNLGCIYTQKGEFDRAQRYFTRSLALYEDIGESQGICVVLDSLIRLTLEKSDFKQAYLYFNRLKQVYKKEKHQKLINLLFRFNKALILKKDPQVFNLTKAKNLLEQIINEEIINFSVYIATLLELCDLLLINLKDTNDLKLLDMIQPHVNQLIENAKKYHSYSLLTETYLLQAKLELITLDLNEAQRTLIKAHHIAEKYGLKLLILRTLNEQDELQKHLDKWERFKNSKAVIAERIELARLDEQLLRMLRKRVYLEKVIF